MFGRVFHRNIRYKGYAEINTITKVFFFFFLVIHINRVCHVTEIQSILKNFTSLRLATSTFGAGMWTLFDSQTEQEELLLVSCLLAKIIWLQPHSKWTDMSRTNVRTNGCLWHRRRRSGP